jgi:hypothetical protein
MTSWRNKQKFKNDPSKKLGPVYFLIIKNAYFNPPVKTN